MTKKAKGLFRYPAAVVVWDDAHARNQAVEYTEDEVRNLHRPEQVVTLGLVIRQDETGISFYTEETGPDAVRGANFIPAAMIKEVIYLGHLRRPKTPRKETAAPKEENPVCSSNQSPA